MGVRLPVRIEALEGRGAGSRAFESSALANAGYEAKECECILPAEAARRLGLWPKPPRRATRETYTGVAGKKVPFVRVPGAIRIGIATEGASPRPIVASAVISTAETEIVLNDTACSALRIVLLDVGSGLWIFRGESAGRPRPSAALQRW